MSVRPELRRYLKNLVEPLWFVWESRELRRNKLMWPRGLHTVYQRTDDRHEGNYKEFLHRASIVELSSAADKWTYKFKSMKKLENTPREKSTH